jgi:hypothetical protein
LLRRLTFPPARLRSLLVRGDELLRRQNICAYPFSLLSPNPALCQTPQTQTHAHAACSEICAWKDPALGLNLTTTFLGRTLNICVPAQRDTGALLYAQPRPGPCASVRDNLLMTGLLGGQYELRFSPESSFLSYSHLRRHFCFSPSSRKIKERACAAPP